MHKLLSFSHGWLNTDDAFNISPRVLKDIYFDKKSKRYKFRDGNRFVSRQNVNELIDRKIEEKRKLLTTYSSRISKQEIGVFGDVAQTLKDLHILQAARFKGFENITQSDLGIIGNQLKKQYYAGIDEETGKKFGIKYLIKDAPDLSIAQIENRLRMYADSTKIASSLLEARRAIETGLTSSRRILGATDAHCKSCLFYASMGFQPIGVLPVPKTACECGSQCLCSIEYK
jgi:hypothetical protein